MAIQLAELSLRRPDRWIRFRSRRAARVGINYRVEASIASQLAAISVHSNCSAGGFRRLLRNRRNAALLKPSIRSRETSGICRTREALTGSTAQSRSGIQHSLSPPFVAQLIDQPIV